MDTGERRFKCGLQVERGYLRAPGDEWCGFQAYYAQDEADVRAALRFVLVDRIDDALSAALVPAVEKTRDQALSA